MESPNGLLFFFFNTYTIVKPIYSLRKENYMVIVVTVIITVYVVGVMGVLCILNEGFKSLGEHYLDDLVIGSDITPKMAKILILIICSLIWPYMLFRILKEKES